MARSRNGRFTKPRCYHSDRMSGDPPGESAPTNPVADSWMRLVLTGPILYGINFFFISMATIAVCGRYCPAGTYANTLHAYGFQIGAPLWDILRLIGWVFYNAHFVPITDGTSSINLIWAFGGEGSSTPFPWPWPVYHLVLAPVLVYFGWGLAGKKLPADASGWVHARVGARVTLGYFPWVLAGVVLFRVGVPNFSLTTLGAPAGPDPLSAAVIGGSLFPLVLTATGGYLATVKRPPEHW